MRDGLMKITMSSSCIVKNVFDFQWRQLADSDKQVYEDKARRINEENTRKWAEEQKAEDDR